MKLKQGGFKFPIHYLYNKLIISIENNSNMSMSSNFSFHCILLISLFLFSSMQQTCSPNYLLPNVIQGKKFLNLDQVIFQPTNASNSYNSTYTYPFPRTFFTNTPSILSSINNFIKHLIIIKLVLFHS